MNKKMKILMNVLISLIVQILLCFGVENSHITGVEISTVGVSGVFISIYIYGIFMDEDILKQNIEKADNGFFISLLNFFVVFITPVFMIYNDWALGYFYFIFLLIAVGRIYFVKYFLD